MMTPSSGDSLAALTPLATQDNHLIPTPVSAIPREKQRPPSQGQSPCYARHKTQRPKPQTRKASMPRGTFSAPPVSQKLCRSSAISLPEKDPCQGVADGLPITHVLPRPRVRMLTRTSPTSLRVMPPNNPRVTLYRFLTPDPRKGSSLSSPIAHAKYWRTASSVCRRVLGDKISDEKPRDPNPLFSGDRNS